MVNALEEADRLQETRQLEEKLAAQQKILEKSRGRSANKDAGKKADGDEIPTISKINADVKAAAVERP